MRSNVADAGGRFAAGPERVKRCAKQLSRSLQDHGRYVPLTRCQDLVSRLYGYDHFAHVRFSHGSEPYGVPDEECGRDELKLRHAFHFEVMAREGFAEVAAAVLGEVRPTAIVVGRGVARRDVSVP